MEPVDFDDLPASDLEAMLAAGERVVESERVLKNTSDNIVGELLRDAGTFYEWNHYPDGDVYDPVSHSQYYYHTHPKDQRPDEHGHFHIFLRPKGMPPGIEPAPLEDYEPPKGDNDALSHLIAISCDPGGTPMKLFTTNRWVTGEVWYGAVDVCRMLNYFIIDHVRPSLAVNIWVSGMVGLFRPQIRALVMDRDAVVAAWAEDHGGDNVFEDRDLEVTNEESISVTGQIAGVREALGRK